MTRYDCPRFRCPYTSRHRGHVAAHIKQSHSVLREWLYRKFLRETR